MTNGLAQALNGNFASLTRVGFVLDENTKKQIASGTESERANALVEVLNSTYKDFNKNLRDTDAGQMQVLANAAQEATTIIGTGLIDAVKSLGDVDSVDNLAQQMEDFAIYTADAIRGIGVLSAKLKSIPVIGGLGFKEILTLIPVAGAYLAEGIDRLERAGRSARIAQENFNFASGGGAGTFSADRISEAARQKKLKDDELKRAKALAKIENDRLKKAREKTALDKAGSLFDQQQTSIIAALKGQVTDEERKRLELQLAILTGNTNEASKLAGELAKSQGLSQQLAAYLASLPDAKNPFTAWKSYLDMIEAQVRRISNPTVAPVVSMASGYGVTGQQYSLPQGTTMTSAAGVDFTVNVNAGSIIAQEQLQDVLRDTLLDASISAKFAAIFRQGGSFGP
jgi:hypothetical protein